MRSKVNIVESPGNLLTFYSYKLLWTMIVIENDQYDYKRPSLALSNNMFSPKSPNGSSGYVLNFFLLNYSDDPSGDFGGKYCWIMPKMVI